MVRNRFTDSFAEANDFSVYPRSYHKPYLFFNYPNHQDTTASIFVISNLCVKLSNHRGFERRFTPPGFCAVKIRFGNNPILAA